MTTNDEKKRIARFNLDIKSRTISPLNSVANNIAKLIKGEIQIDDLDICLELGFKVKVNGLNLIHTY
jgi:hypothetical protein